MSAQSATLGVLCIVLTATIISLPFFVMEEKSDTPQWLSDAQPTVSGKSYPAGDIRYKRIPLWTEVKQLPLIANVQIHDYDKNGQTEAIVCDLQQNAVFAYPMQADGSYKEVTLVNDLRMPAHCTFADINRDGKEDLLVANLGDLFPNNERVGQVLFFEKTEAGYKKHVIANHVRRIADIQAGDFDGDGDQDLVVAEFGHFEGSVFLLEQVKPLTFKRHNLLIGCGSIHTPVADFDGDGDLDIATVLSQDEEEVWILENDGRGQFKNHLVYHNANYELGCGGLVASDVDQDGDVDLLLPAGDNLERSIHFPLQFHGCYWIENKGSLKFETQRIGDLPGTYAVDAGDLDQDGDIDVVLVSMSNDYSNPNAASIVALINDGAQQFKPTQIDSIPIQLITCAIGDLNNDGKNDILAGALRIHPPFRHMSRISAWIQEP